MKMLVTGLALLVFLGAAFAAFDPRAHKVVTPTGRTAHPDAQFTIAAVERGAAKQEKAQMKEERRKKEAERRGEVYLSDFEIRYPRFPRKKEVIEMKSLLEPEDQIWAFRGLDSGWIILRGDKEIYQLVTEHEY